eukprot:TRINITY_DN7309_c0_g1_i1.p2 TRINITY_DN7309_c0_g1~~TRINITY_DN7309_c0_g1_i1.p2  ORF type:complete len:185 (-),score=61.71 TRINITY_DN7309_c0_g1_i1:457-1011(-)
MVSAAAEAWREREVGQEVPLLNGSGDANSRCDSYVESPPRKAPGAEATEFEQERARVEADAKQLLDRQSAGLRMGATRSETSDALREVCQTFQDMSTELTQTWRRYHKNDPVPPLAIEVVAEEELKKVRWDFHANRVQMAGSENIFMSLMYLFQGDQEASFSKPPDSQEALMAMKRIADRLPAS